MMDVTGNNIANVNTVGFKSAPGRLRGHAQPDDAGRRRARSDGAAAPTRRRSASACRVAGDHHELHPGRRPDHRPLTDMMIQGDGFFVVQQRRRAALHPRRLVRLRRQRPAGHPGRRRSCRAGWPTPTAPSTPTAPIGDIQLPIGPRCSPPQRHRPSRRSAATCRPTPPIGTAIADARSRCYDAQGNGAHADLRRSPRPARPRGTLDRQRRDEHHRRPRRRHRPS